MATALELFRAGNDTAQIAFKLRITEANALKQVTSQRSASLGLPYPYKSSLPGQGPWPSGRIGYAGRHK